MEMVFVLVNPFHLRQDVIRVVVRMKCVCVPVECVNVKIKSPSVAIQSVVTDISVYVMGMVFVLVNPFHLRQDVIRVAVRMKYACVPGECVNVKIKSPAVAIQSVVTGINVYVMEMVFVLVNPFHLLLQVAVRIANRIRYVQRLTVCISVSISITRVEIKTATLMRYV
jgi:flagellar assembly factor FliW